jgi:hypothetical protein
MRALEDELRELKVLSNVKDDQIRAKDGAFERLREAYEASTDPALKGVATAASRVMKQTGSHGSLHTGAGKSAPNTPATGSKAVAASPWASSSTAPASSKKANKQQNSSNSSGGSDSGESAIIDTLRRQLVLAQRAAEASALEVQRLHATVAAREHELSRGTRMTITSDSSSSSNANNAAAGGDASGSGRAEQLELSDVANKRIIDQLNGQVDFLNEQLALREAQLVESADKAREFDSVQADLAVK